MSRQVGEIVDFEPEPESLVHQGSGGSVKETVTGTVPYGTGTVRYLL